MDRDGRHVLRGSGCISDLEIALQSQNSNHACRMRFARVAGAASSTGGLPKLFLPKTVRQQTNRMIEKEDRRRRIRLCRMLLCKIKICL
jgi:hypothetical protein